MKISTDNRDTLLRIAREELNGSTLNEVISALIFEHESLQSMASLAEDPNALTEFQQEAKELAEIDIAIHDDISHFRNAA